MSDELVLLAGKTGYFKITHGTGMDIGDYFTFETGAVDEDLNTKAITATIPQANAEQLVAFINNKLKEEE